VNPGPIYRQVMGVHFAALPAAVRRFHGLQGRFLLQGWVETDPPASFAARLIARLLGTPLQQTSGGLTFELEADPDAETWTRRFPSQTMMSRMQIEAGKLTEQIGAVRLTFDLASADEHLQMRLLRVRFLGIPCPGWLMPNVVAEEYGHDDRLHFRVAASLPLVGVIASYRGHLVVPAEGAR
jgi:hypothetical protein